MKLNSRIIGLVLFGALSINVVHAALGLALKPPIINSFIIGQTNIPQNINARAIVYACIIFGGLLGGLIYSISRNQGFVIPKRYMFKDGDNEFWKLGLGTFADMLVGLGGGILIFLLVPYTGDNDLITTLIQNVGKDAEASSLLKVIALTLVGGFAGISLFDEAAKRITRKVDELNTTVEELDATAKDNRKQIDDIADGATQEAEIQFLLSPLLDPSISQLNSEQLEELKKSIISAPINVQNWVFSQTQNACNQYWIMGRNLNVADVETNRELFEQLILPFQALVQAAKLKQKETGYLDAYMHRYLAHIAFCQQQIAAANQILGKN